MNNSNKVCYLCNTVWRANGYTCPNCGSSMLVTNTRIRPPKKNAKNKWKQFWKYFRPNYIDGEFFPYYKRKKD